MQDKQVPLDVIEAARQKLQPLITLLPGQAAQPDVATFLAESDNITRILKVYGDTLNARKDVSAQAHTQNAQVSSGLGMLHCTQELRI